MSAKENFPINFAVIHSGEEALRGQSVAAVTTSEALSAHAKTIEASTSLIQHVIIRDDHSSDDDLTVRLLGIRLVNDISSALKLLMSGYYQSAALIQRDIIETAFLLGDMQIDRGQIARWREADAKTLKTVFQPVNVRKRLDEHYKQEGQKRAEGYKLYSELAAHPHPRGFVMLRRQGEDTHNSGPFFDEGGLTATLTELARHSIECAETLSAFFVFPTRADREVQFAAFLAKVEWFERFFEKPYDRAQVAGIRAAIDRM